MSRPYISLLLKFIMKGDTNIACPQFLRGPISITTHRAKTPKEYVTEHVFGKFTSELNTYITNV